MAWLLPKSPSLWSAEQTIQSTIEYTVGQAENQLLTEPLITQKAVTAEALNAWSILDVFMVLYLIGLLFFATRFLWQTYQLLRFIGESPKQNYGHHILVEPVVETMPFSFFKYLILPKNIQSTALRRQIIDHELVHLSQKHSIDLMIANLLKVLCWFNPMVWIYRNLIEQNQEFLVDQTLLKAGIDPKVYQFNLLKVQFPKRLSLLTNSYNFSFIKKRIQMMQTKLNPSKNWSGYVLLSVALIPLLLIFGKSTSTLSQPMLDNENGNDILIIYDHYTTYQELEDLQAPLEAAGFELLIEDFRSNQEGVITNIRITVNGVLEEESASSSYTISKDEQQNGFLNYFYLDPEGASACGGLSDDNFKKLLDMQNNVTVYALGNFANNVEKKAPPTGELSEVEKKYIRSNNYRGKSVIASATFTLENKEPEQYEKTIEGVKKYIKNIGSTLKLEPTYFLNNERLDGSVFDQALIEIEVQNISRPAYDKDLKLKMWENFELKVIAKTD
ncbi:MAG: hypothetical protein Sapg2KO_38230 [Saprospiraceae bacterium]